MNPFKDDNRPETYGYHYDRTTDAHSRTTTRPYVPFTRWEKEVVAEILIEELNKTLNNK